MALRLGTHCVPSANSTLATNAEAQGRVLGHLAALIRGKLYIARDRSCLKLASLLAFHQPADFEMLYGAVGTVTDIESRRARFVAGHSRESVG